MDFERKLKVGTLAEAQDYPEDRLQDVLAAVRVKLEQTDRQCMEIDEENAALEEQIKQALTYQAKLYDQGRETSNQLASAK